MGTLIAVQTHLDLYPVLSVQFADTLGLLVYDILFCDYRNKYLLIFYFNAHRNSNRGVVQAGDL
jgi:hypothetical protein